MRSGVLSLAALALSGCVAGVEAPESGIRITPDEPANPKHVRFDVPAAYVLGFPGDRMPITVQARISTREIAGTYLEALGYCPRGFWGPDAVFAPDGDRSRSAFIVDCLAP